MSAPLRTLDIASSPHIRAGLGVDRIMFNVVLALLPVVAFAVYAFGLAALLGIATATASCVLSEHLLCRLAGKPSSKRPSIVQSGSIRRTRTLLVTASIEALPQTPQLELV